MSRSFLHCKTYQSMNAGELAYKAWCECLDHLTHPDWTDLTADEKVAWQYVFESVKRALDK